MRWLFHIGLLGFIENIETLQDISWKEKAKQKSTPPKKQKQI